MLFHYNRCTGTKNIFILNLSSKLICGEVKCCRDHYYDYYKHHSHKIERHIIWLVSASTPGTPHIILCDRAGTPGTPCRAPYYMVQPFGYTWHSLQSPILYGATLLVHQALPAEPHIISMALPAEPLESTASFRTIELGV